MKNEDLTQYIQAFTIFENMFSALGYDTFVVHGVTFTANGANFDISQGVIYYDGELCLFLGATNVSLPYRLSKQRVQINPRTFQDSVTRNTAESVRVVADQVGPLQLNQNVNRAEDRFFRIVSGNLRANIDGNNNGRGNIWKSLLSERIENVRRIPQPPGVNRYLRLGTIPISDSQAHHFLISGIDVNDGVFAYLKFYRINIVASDTCIVEVYFFEESGSDAQRPVFYVRRNDTQSVFELWLKSPGSVGPGDLSSGVISLVAEDFTGNENAFSFENTFTWQSTVPSGIQEGVARIYATTDDLSIAVRNINNQLTPLTQDSGWLTATDGPDAIAISTTVFVRRFGNIVNVYGQAQANGVGLVDLVILPAAIPAPSRDITFDANNTTTRNFSSGTLLINKTLRFVSSASGNSFSFNFMYISG